MLARGIDSVILCKTRRILGLPVVVTGLLEENVETTFCSILLSLYQPNIR